MIARLVARWPAFALLCSLETLMHRIRCTTPTCPDAALDEAPVVCGDIEAAPDRLNREDGVRTEDQEPDGRMLQRRAWSWAHTVFSETGELPTGATIGARFSRTPRWGRLVKQVGCEGQYD